MDISLITSFFAHPPLDWVIFGVLVLIIGIDALRSGTARAATLSIALPVTLFFSNTLSHAILVGPFIDKFSNPLIEAAIFGGIFIVVFFLTYRIMYSLGGNAAPPFASIMASFAATIVMYVMWLQVPALQSVWHFGPQIQSIFGALYAFWWMLVAYLALAFIRS